MPASKKQVTPYLIYTALLTQSGTSAPTATVLQNTFTGGTFSWVYISTGTYELRYTGSEAFGFTNFCCIFGSFVITANMFDNSVNIYNAGIAGAGNNGVRITSNKCDLVGQTVAVANDLMTRTPFEVRVY